MPHMGDIQIHVDIAVRMLRFVIGKDGDDISYCQFYVISFICLFV